MWKLKQIYHSFKNIIRWIPILWKDRDWDWHFLLIIIQFKLKRMEKYHRKHGTSLNANKYADDMRKVHLAIGRILNETRYCELDYKHHEEKYGELQMLDGEKTKYGTTIKFWYSKVNTEEEYEEASKAARKIYERADYLKKQDFDFIFKEMRKHIRDWWD